MKIFRFILALPFILISTAAVLTIMTLITVLWFVHMFSNGISEFIQGEL